MLVSPSVSSGGVSIMMPAYNAAPFIAQAIASVLAQRFSNWELLVVDDGSTDGTGAIAAAHRDARIRVFGQANRGEAAARNTALDHVRGEYVAFLDADDLLLPNHLEATVHYLRSHPDHVGVYTDGHYINEAGQPLKTLASRRRGPMTGRLFDEVVRGPDVFGPPVCVVLRRAPIEQSALRFDETLVIGPDWDFFVRVADTGTFGYLNEGTCLYRVHRTNITQRVGSQARALELAKCRTNAIKLASFAACSLDVRVSVFYDLLVDLLREHPDKQQAVLSWPEFRALPRVEQARLLRLMASKALVFSDNPAAAGRYLVHSCKLNPAGVRGVVLLALYCVSWRLCRNLLRLRASNQSDPLEAPPFADLET